MTLEELKNIAKEIPKPVAGSQLCKLYEALANAISLIDDDAPPGSYDAVLSGAGFGRSSSSDRLYLRLVFTCDDPSVGNLVQHFVLDGPSAEFARRAVEQLGVPASHPEGLWGRIVGQLMEKRRRCRITLKYHKGFSLVTIDEVIA